MAPRVACFVVLLLGLTACSGEVAAPADVAAATSPTFFPDTVSTPAALIAKGERVSWVLGCHGCHGADMTGQVWEDEPDFAVMYASNLTLAVADYDNAQLEHLLRAGVRPDGSVLWEMPSEIFQHIGAADMAALLAYLNTVPPQGERHPLIVMGPDGLAEVEAGTFRPAPELVALAADMTPGDFGEENEFGRYIISVTCAECHGPTLAGGGDTPSLDLIANYTREEFIHLMQTGEPNSGAELGLMGQVARSRFSRFTDAERDAVYDYLTAWSNRE